MVTKQAPKPEAMLMFESTTTNANKIMNQLPENLTTNDDYDMSCANSKSSIDDKQSKVKPTESTHPAQSQTTSAATKIKLSFSVDRLLSLEGKRAGVEHLPQVNILSGKSDDACCESPYACCSYTQCYVPSTQHSPSPYAIHATYPSGMQASDSMLKLFPQTPFADYKSLVRPVPVRAIGSAADNVTVCTPAYPTLATSALLRFHHHQQQQQQQQQQKSLALTPTAMMTPLNGLKSLQLSQQNRFLGKTPTHGLLDMPTALPTPTAAATSGSSGAATTQNGGGSSGGAGSGNNNTLGGKRKRSWSRAVFTNLQRKGLEIQFQQQKYITKPDRRKLAARLNLTDAQVKVWFQNRRMKWRHTRENLKSGQEKQTCVASTSNGSENLTDAVVAAAERAELVGYSSDGTSSVELSENEADDDGDEIDVVE